MSLETSYRVAHGFVLSNEEAHTFPLEQYDFLTENDILIPLSTWHANSDYIFALSTTEVYEGKVVDLTADLPIDSYYWSIFRTQFPHRAEENPKKLAFIQLY